MTSPEIVSSLCAGKALFDVSLPKPGVYKLLISASVEGSPFTRVLTYYLSALSDYIAPQPVNVPPAFLAEGVRPLNQRYQVIQAKDISSIISIKWRVPAGVHVKATLKENAQRLDASSFVVVRRESDDVVAVDVMLPAPAPPKRPQPQQRGVAVAVTQPAYVLSLFLRPEDEVGFRYLTNYILMAPEPTGRGGR